MNDLLDTYYQEMRSALNLYEHCIRAGNIAYRDLKAELVMKGIQQGIELDRAAVNHQSSQEMEQETDAAADAVLQALTRYLVAQVETFGEHERAELEKLGDLATLAERHPQKAMDLARRLA